MSHTWTRGPRRNDYGNRGNHNHGDSRRDRPPQVADEILATRIVEGERKTLTLSRRRNAGGEFLRLDEQRKGSKFGPSVVIIPIEMVDQVLAVADELVPLSAGEAASATPAGGAAKQPAQQTA